MTEPKKRGSKNSVAERREFGRRLKQVAQAAGYTSERIAEALDVSAGAVRTWWIGKNEPSRDRLTEYARLTGVSVTYLITGSAEPMGPSGSLQEWRLRFAELVASGMNPLEAIDAITGTRPGNESGIPADRLTAEEREILGGPGTGEAMRQALEEASGGAWDRLSPARKELVLQMIEELARSATDEPGR